ncbi:hypothetical protein O181_013524 [Austropuccinia psidii MF-1]|uniref:Uncharacterized protein n=1 Tax=Austropuccinia psidii MF-1 TaxID=1389203 RepID=A0A9Q3BYE4_9BASI|nr:hypothetical protein [Austropuccinia psidii MF-1]
MRFWKPRLTYETLKKDFVDIHPTASCFEIILDKERHHENRCIQEYFKSAKERWDKSQKPPDFKVGDLVLVSNLNLNSIKGPNNFKDSLLEPFMIKALHGPNSLQVELTGELRKKHPSFPVSLIKPYRLSDKELSPLRSIPLLKTPPIEEGEEKIIENSLKKGGQEKKRKGIPYIVQKPKSRV